jgi:predicted TIM-barrel fold metal-dependent hydrolase
MRMEDMILISVDDHIVEPPDMFDGLAPARFRDRLPRMVEKDGVNAWLFEGETVLNVALNAVAGRPREEYGMEPTSLDQLRKGTYDVHARIDDMNVNGVLASLNFGSFAGICGQLFARSKDKDLALAALQAYNDWHIDKWCAAYPGRFIPCAMVPLWDAEVAAREVRRVKDKGCNSIAFMPNPTKAGWPSIHSDSWDPLWRACVDNDMTINTHINDVSGAIPSMDSPVDVFITVLPVSLYANAADLVWSPILRKFPGIRYAMSEGGVGWIPHLLERLDYTHEHQQWTRQDFGGKKPSEVFKAQCWTCFIDDRAGILQRDLIGVDKMMWECDYPHSDSLWPHSPEYLWKSLCDIPEDEIHMITHRNAMACYRFDPFAHVAPADATVGALRAKAAHVDTAPLPTQFAGRPPSDRDSGPITMRDVEAQLSSHVNFESA